ncbi:MAG: Peptidoglycan glycosyltransferase [Parcubacteria group bacterium GW2011_GWC1_45_13]|uniref:Peptidoglycan glycosyltransferase n=2 Tax=Candidatus Giovannoniibacteriota TaxID=1752738 RepID=A0A0G1IXU6_9BACT|nr:MAG: Peptidoglycan glycosyltransferase [Candidatus Giovannonibacteria bacterium GW2011_GWB1_44_23]KKT63910.1 MAG: Peptidoglycan glycosyltransferase [Candidatus Giovannonibacteria bacterium GW2011_GWA1_44_29]KKT91623.1 MAG: Peptidoglycan glycosyltransferase [Parcubacteria group bacterium GW2011_GWC1_45_13]
MRKNKIFTSNNRLGLTLAIIVLISTAVAGRLFFIQIVRYPVYRDLAKKQQRFSEILEPKRGDIYYKNKNGELVKAATTKIGALLYLNTKLLKDPENIFNKLNAITPIDRVLFDKIANKTNDPYEILKHRLNQEEADKISVLNLPGVGLAKERWRAYPMGDTGSQILGFVSSLSAEEEPVGRYGAEKYYDDSLRGAKGSVSGDKDAKGILIALGEDLRAEPAEGQDLVLTIEPTVQRTAEEELKKLREKWRAAAGGILIIDPKTGAIKALAGSPDFDPNKYQAENNLGVFLNPYVEKIFELGSVFKPLTMSAALDQGAVTPYTTYVDMGQIKIGDRIIKNFDGKAHGTRTMTQVLEESLNTGAVFAMQRVGGEKLKEYFHKFGLADKTGIDLPGELKGNLSNLESGREVEFATAAFGQGVAVTPLELAMALSALANGGHLMKPFIKDGTAPQIIRDVIKPQTSETITKMLVDVVDMSLAGGKAKIPQMSIAAKTGTAQVVNIGGRGYSDDQFLHSFFGYFPAYDPKFLILIFLEKPQGVKYASQSITDTFRSVVDFLINYYTIPPDR